LPIPTMMRPEMMLPDLRFPTLMRHSILEMREDAPYFMHQLHFMYSTMQSGIVWCLGIYRLKPRSQRAANICYHYYYWIAFPIQWFVVCMHDKTGWKVCTFVFFLPSWFWLLFSLSSRTMKLFRFMGNS